MTLNLSESMELTFVNACTHRGGCERCRPKGRSVFDKVHPEWQLIYKSAVQRRGLSCRC